MASFLPAGGAGGAGGGIVYPDSASRPFNSNAARNTWANNNKEDLIKDTTVVNVDGTQWYLWTGESNPDTVSSSLWMDANQIVQGEQGQQGNPGVSVTGAQIDGNGDLIIEKSDGDSINAGRAKGDPGGKVPHVLLTIPDGQLNASTDGQTFDLANKGNFDGYWEAINPATQISGGPNPPDGNFDIIDAEISIDFYQELNTSVTPNRVKQELTTFQGGRKTVYYREGFNQVGGSESLSNSDWSIKNMIPIFANSVTGTSAIPARVIQLGQGMQADFQQDTAVIKSLAPFSEVVDIFASTTIGSPSDNRTYSYKADDLSQQDFLWLNLDEDDLADEWSIVVEVQYNSYSSLEVFFGTGRVRLFALFPGDGVIFKKINGNIQNFKISGVERNTLPAEFLNGQNASWPNVPNNNYTIDQGTFTNWHPTVDGKQGYIFAQTFNDNFVQPGELPKVIHRYTFFCTNDDDVTGTVLIKTTRDKSELPSIQGKILGEGGGGGESGLPDNGAIDNLTSSFENLAVGKWYVDGWENSSGLPDWDNPDRVASLTVFGGYDGDANGAYWNLVSHRKGIYGAAKSSGVTSDWLRLDNATQVITSSSPLEVRKTGGGDHDAVAVTDAGTLVFGTASPEITETQFRSSQRRFSADVRNSDNTGQSLEQLAYVSDITSLEGSAIQWQRVMDAEPVSSGAYILEATDSQTGQVVKSNDNDLLVLTYVSSEEYVYTLPLGMVRERKERTGQDYDFYSSTVQWVASENHFVIEVTESANQKSFDFSINGANRIELSQQIIKQGAKEGYSPWTRASTLNILPSELPKTIEVMAQPYVADADDVNTLQINLPSKGDFEQYYHIPGVNDQQAADNDLPNIESFEFIVFIDHFESQGKDDKVILRSEADWMPMYGNQNIHHYDGIYILRKDKETATPHRSVFKFRKLIQGATTGPWDGYTLVSQDANLWNEVGTNYSQAATVDNSQNTFVMTDDDGNHFTVIKRIQPVYATVDLSKYQLIKLSSDTDSSSGDFPEVIAGTVGEVASGFALAFDDANDTIANTSIYQISSGEFELSTAGSNTGDSVYVDEDTGVVTLDASPYPCGWIVNGGVVLDIDIYNASTLSGTANDNLATKDEVAEAISDNNDLIITPNPGEQFLLRDSDKDAGYGDNGSITYFQPQAAGQQDTINNNLSISKSYFVHSKLNTLSGFLILHEDYVSQIYAQDLTDVTELTMLFGSKSAGRFGKSNQTAPVNALINWNGEYIPNTQDPQDLNPTQWIGKDGEVTDQWTKNGVLSPCYSVGMLSNNGTALLRRGDVTYQNNNGDKTTQFVADPDSSLFVIPVNTGGGTFGDVKLFPFFMSRKEQVQTEWESFTFTNNADCVGSILKIAYETAIEAVSEEVDIVIGTDQVSASSYGYKLFKYVDGMPYHGLISTPTSSRLIHNFAPSKTFKFTPLAERTYEGVVASTSNEAGVPSLGQYSDIPLYCFEPNAVVSRDQIGFINWPSTVQIDVSEGFYVFGTVSGWAGGADRNGTTAVYVGRNADNPKGGGGKIGFALIADKLVILTGNGAQDSENATSSQFNKESGVAHFYRYAFYVDSDGNMIYFIKDINDGVVHQGTATVNLASLSNDSRLYVAYDREGANTSTIAVGETTLVMNNEGDGEQRWNWRN